MDPLEEYRAKRDFGRTPEPIHAPSVGTGPLRYVLQRHFAQREHFDLRLELGGVLKSWAVPKGLSANPEEKRFAVATEDHPLDYARFEGIIPSGNYGAGEMLVVDAGTWFADESAPLGDFGDPAVRAAHEAVILLQIEAGKLSFFLRGQRWHGSWALVKTKEGWLVFKHRDAWADRPAPDLGSSVASGRTRETLSGSGLLDSRMFPEGSMEPMPLKLHPMKAEVGEVPFDSPEWLFEPKLDGIRALAYCDDQRVSLESRSGAEISASFPEIVRHLQRQRIRAVLDGEIVAFEQGRPGFGAMMKRFHLRDPGLIAQAEVELPSVLYLFDLLHIDGLNLRNAGTLDRRRWLRQAIGNTERIQVTEHLVAEGKTFYRAVVAAGFEGAMAKRCDARYDASGKASRHWLKLKYTSSREFAIGGWSQGEGSRSDTFGALYIGFWDETGDFRCSGRVGSGFKEDQLTEIRKKLEPLVTADCPFEGPVDTEGHTTWTRPELVVEVKYSEVMPSGHLRMPIFLRLRPDRDASDVGPLRTGRGEFEPTLETPPVLPLEPVLAQLDGPEKSLTLEVGEYRIDLTNLNKTLWPAQGERRAWMKRDLLRYLIRISPWMLPHLADRPVTLIRYPDGIQGGSFFQKHMEQGRADFIPVVQFWSDTHQRDQDYLKAEKLIDLIFYGQVGALEYHVPAGRVVADGAAASGSTLFTGSDENLESSVFNFPDFVRFDLDPQIFSGHEKPGDEPELNRIAFDRTKEVAFWIRELLRPMGIPLFVKTTGKTGLHLFVPIDRNLDTPACKQLCAVLCQTLERMHPREITTAYQVEKRTGKVFLDYNMNGMGRTLAAAYSPRANPFQGVSTPLSWEELETVYAGDLTMESVPEWVARRGDPWAEILQARVDLPKLLG